MLAMALTGVGQPLQALDLPVLRPGMGYALPGSDTAHKASIKPRGIGVLVYSIQRSAEDRFLITTSELHNKMAVLLGGRPSNQSSGICRPARVTTSPGWRVSPARW